VIESHDRQIGELGHKIDRVGDKVDRLASKIDKLADKVDKVTDSAANPVSVTSDDVAAIQMLKAHRQQSI
jgi:outer membrane murein-binding lipoprotein Lpp